MAGECSGRGHDKRSQGRKSSEGLETFLIHRAQINFNVYRAVGLELIPF